MKLRSILKSLILEKNIGSIPWYHGSSDRIKKFDYNKVGSNEDHITNYHGWGIYFISKLERAKKYGDVVTEVKISSSADILQGKITPEQCKKIYDGLEKLGIKDEYWLNPKYDEYSILNDVEEFYDGMGRFYRKHINSSKSVSNFLLSCGIDGLLVVNDVNDEILVVFNDKIITVTGYL